MKKLPADGQRVKSTVIGLDVHKRLIVYSILDRRGEEIESGRFDSSRRCLEDFLVEKVGRRKVHFAFEAGRSSMWVHGLCGFRKVWRSDSGKSGGLIGAA